jgi:hypothetical protein
MMIPATMIAGGSMSKTDWKRIGLFAILMLGVNYFAPGLASFVLGAVILAALIANADRISRAVGLGGKR